MNQKIKGIWVSQFMTHLTITIGTLFCTMGEKFMSFQSKIMQTFYSFFNLEVVNIQIHFEYGSECRFHTQIILMNRVYKVIFMGRPG